MSNPRWHIACVLLLGVSWGGESEAARPFTTTERGTMLEHGVSQLEMGIESARFSVQTTRYTVLSELTYGLLNHLNFEVEAPYFFVTGAGGTQGVVGDVTLRPKILFLKGREANPLFLAGEMVLKFPSCDEGSIAASVSPGCTGETDLGVIGIATKEFGSLTVHLNLGYIFVGNPPGRTLDNVVSYSLAFEYATLLPAITLVTEVASETDRRPGTADDPATWLFGVVYEVNRRVRLDSSVVLGLTSKSPDYGALLGMSYTF